MEMQERTVEQKVDTNSSQNHPVYNTASIQLEQGTQLQIQCNITDAVAKKQFPQPTNDPLDPLNWTAFQKHSILCIVMLKYFLFTYITTTTVPSFVKIQSQYGISYSQANWTIAIPALGLAVGPLVWSSLGDIYGRRQIFLTGTLIALISTIGAAVADSYQGYMVARFFQGFGVSPASTVGMAVVNDLFFEYERGQKLGLWVLAVDSGLLLGPTLGGFLDIVSSAWVNWFSAILFACLIFLELFFMPETLYPRQYVLLSMGTQVTRHRYGEKETKNEVSEPSTSRARLPENILYHDIRRTKSLPFITFHPIPGMKHPRPWDSFIRLILTFRFPVIVIAVVGYSFTWYWWTLSIITMVPAAYPQYTPVVQGLLFIGLFVGTLISEICFSGRLSDWIVTVLMKQNKSIRTPEMRLWLSYPAILITAAGAIIWGVSIDKNYHWVVGQVAFFLFSAGIQIGNTVISTYIIDAYPLQSTSTITFYAVFFNLSAFINPFFINPWEEACGWTWTFTTQALVVLFVSTLLMLVLHNYGAWLRQNSPKPSWVNPEYDLDI